MGIITNEKQNARIAKKAIASKFKKKTEREFQRETRRFKKSTKRVDF